MKEKKLTQERLKELLHYDPETGLFTRIVSGRGFKIGDIAGNITKKGYRVIRIDRMAFMSHRLAFLYMEGVFPRHYVDHINSDRADNRWCNLRHATIAENLRNKRMRHDNKTGRKGVTRRRDKYCAQIMFNGKHHYLGLFPDADLAHEVYMEASKRLHGDFGRYD